jgi:hypothetical protein
VYRRRVLALSPVLLGGERPLSGSPEFQASISVEDVRQQHLALWSDQREFLIVDWNNQVHHFGEPSLRPSGVAAETPAPKKKASKKKA